MSKLKLLLWSLGGFAILFCMIAFIFWNISTYQLNHGWQPPQCREESAWFINRRFGEDTNLGNISNTEARELAGNNIIYFKNYEECK